MSRTLLSFVQDAFADAQALIFDFDGTLVDSMPAHLASWRAAFAEWGVEFPESLFWELAGVRLPEVVAAYNRRFGTALPPDAVVECKIYWHAHQRAPVSCIAPVMDVVRAYHGRLPLAIATGNARRTTEPVVRQLGLHRYFSCVVYGEDVERPKPAPDCFLAAAAHVGVPPQRCVVFEDGEPGLCGARDAGMRAVDIRPFARQEPRVS